MVVNKKATSANDNAVGQQHTNSPPPGSPLSSSGSYQTLEPVEHDFAIGDVHGCYRQLMALLHHCGFEPTRDCLWLTGDLVNRGPDSLSVLRFLYALERKPRICLGNHDLYFLSIYCGTQPLPDNNPSFAELLAAPDIDLLAEWLLQQPLLQHDPSLGVIMTHAGVYPAWHLSQLLALSEETARQYQSAKTRKHYFANLLGELPDHWQDDLSPEERYRFITNVLTRMRYLSTDGQRLLLQYTTLTNDPHATPWFKKVDAAALGRTLVFGHWAALNGQVTVPNIHGLDTGCYRGGPLTALCLQTQQRFELARFSGVGD